MCLMHMQQIALCHIVMRNLPIPTATMETNTRPLSQILVQHHVVPLVQLPNGYDLLMVIG